MTIEAKPFDPNELLDQQVTAGQFQAAGQWAMVWAKFKKHKLAVISLVVVGLIYFVALFAEFLAPYDPGKFDPRYTYVPPQSIGFLVDDGAGGSMFQPHVTGYKIELNPVSFRREFTTDPEVIIPIGFFVEGQPYKLWGLFDSNRHLIGPLDQSQPFFLAGGDRLGRDLLSRTIHGTRISMSIGLVGVGLSLVMPSLYSHIIAAITLAIPNMILAETSLSFMGLGLQPPIVSWGVLLQDTQNLRAITQAPWLFIPGLCVVIAVLSLNFLGDGVRDAADPYAK